MTHWKLGTEEEKPSGWPNAVVMLGLYALIAFILQLIIR